MMPSLTMGIEEEYLLVDPESRDLVTDPPASFMADCKEALGDQVTHEFLKCQVEVGTPVCADITEARRHLTTLRRTLIRMAEKAGMRLMAASTHPFAKWDRQQHTPAPRYDLLDADMQGIIRRMLICGMHVHLGIEDPDQRIDLMNQARYFLPHLLALSTSSPYWGGHDMGMKCCRLSIFDSMPRTGIPDRFESFSEYERMVNRFVEAGVMEDASKIWWDMRPSARFPTVEMRITDICTRLEDALAVAALYQSLMHMLARLQKSNLRWRIYPRMMMEENRWRAQRYGIGKSLIDLGRGRCSTFPVLLEEMLEMIEEDARSLGCLNEVRHARTIVARGTSACGQTATYAAEIDKGASHDEAMRTVVDYLIAETAADLP